MYSLGDFLEEGVDQLRDLVDWLGPDNVILSVILIGFFFLISKVLLKTKLGLFMDEYDQPKGGAIGIFAFVASLTITWFVNYSGAIESLHAGDLFDYLGYSSGPSATIIPLVVLGIFIYIIFKIGPAFLIISGLALMGISTTDLIYSTGAGIFTGFVLLLVGILWVVKRRRTETGENKNNLSFLAILSAIGLILAYIIASVLAFYIAIIFLIVYFVFIIILWLKRRAKWVASKYDWEKEKRQARAIGKGFLWGGKKVAGAGKWVGGKTKTGFGYAKNAGAASWQKTKQAKDWAKRQAEEAKKRREEQNESREKAYKEAQEKLSGETEEKLRAKIRKLRREYVDIESKTRGKVSTDRMRELVKEIQRLKKKLNSL